MAKKSLTQQEFIERSTSVHSGFYTYGNSVFINTKTKVEITCSIHKGFFQQPGVHMRGQGCPSCHKDNMRKKRKERESNKPAPKPRGNPFAKKTPEEMADIIARRKEATIKKYGVENPSQSEEIKRKKVLTLLRNYGVENPMYSDDIKEKIKTTNSDRYGVTNPARKHMDARVEEVLENARLLKEYMEGKNFVEAMEGLGICQTTLSKYLTMYSIRDGGRSSYERQIKAFLVSLGFDPKTDDRSILKNKDNPSKSKEIDFVIPEKNIGIEFHGLQCHSVIDLEKRGISPNSYHSDKTKGCKKKGIHLITIFEDEWLDKQEIIKSVLKNKLGLSEKGPGARSLEVKYISWVEARDFTEKHHIQGKPTGITHRIGAFHNEELVATMLFGEPNRPGSCEIELKRFCTNGKSYAGLASKMFKYFVRNESPKSIISFADLRWADGGVYDKLGFINEETIPPSYFYVKADGPDKYRNRFNKSRFTRERISKKFGVDITGKSEQQLMKELGFDRIYDCGKIRFVWRP